MQQDDFISCVLCDGEVDPETMECKECHTRHITLSAKDYEDMWIRD